MKEENLKKAQQDIEDALKTVEDLEKGLDSDIMSRDDIKERFISLTDKLQKLEDILKNEGILRDIIRQCQVYRKEAEFNVDDRITIYFESDDKDIMNILNKNEELIKSELLAKVEKLDKCDFECKFEDINLTVKMKKNS